MQTQLFKKLYAVADIIGDSFNVFFKNIVNLLLFQLIYVGAVIAGMIPCLTYLALKIGPVLVLSADLPQEQAQQAALDAFKTIAADPYFWLLFAALFIILIIAAVWKMAAVSAYLESKLLGAPLNIWQSFKKSYYRITPFVFTILAVGLAVYVLPFIFTGAAVFAFVSENYALGAAGIFGAFITFIAAWFAFMSVLPLPQVLALKGKNYTDAVKYSWRLVRGNYWPTVGFILLVVAVMFGFAIAAMIIQMVVQMIGALLAMIASVVPFMGIVVMVVLMLAVFVIQILPQCYMDVPLVMYYVNREAMKGDGTGPVAEAARAAQTAPQTPQEPDPKNIVQLETPPQN